MARLRAALFVILILQITLVASSRQKRCIVIQRQSGALAESVEDEEDWREARHPKNNRNHLKDVEVILPEFLKFLGPAMKTEFIRFRNKFNALKRNVPKS